MAIYLQGVGASAVLFTVGGTDLTDHVRSLTINQDFDDIDITPMNAVSKQHAVGLRDDSWEVEFFQDFAAGSVDAVLSPLLGSSTGATLVYQTSGTTVGTSNPKYSMVGNLFSYQPVNGEVGAASMITVTFMPAQGSSTTRATS
jgi:hypothetical protein